MIDPLESLKALVEARSESTPGKWDNNLYGSVTTEVPGYGNRKILDIRGWGYLTGILKLTSEQAARCQDADAAFVAQAANWTATSAPILIERMERMQRALEFYSKEANWRTEWDKQFSCWVCDAVSDSGERARAALVEKE